MYAPVSRPFSYPDSAIQDLHEQFANPLGRKSKRQASGNCSLTAPPTPVLSSSSTTAAPSVSCQYQDGMPEQSEECTCVSGSSTTVVQPMTLSSISIITQSCDYTTWPYFQLTEVDPTSNGPARELSFSLGFQTDTRGFIVRKLLADVVEFIETTIVLQTDTEETLPEELKVDQKLLAAYESAGVGSKF